MGERTGTRGKEPHNYIIIQVDRLPVDRMIDAILNGKFVQGVRYRTPFGFCYLLFINHLRFWHRFGI